MEEKLYLAADSGGSKTVWMLLKENGDLVAKVRTNGLGAVREGVLPVLQTVMEAFKTLDSYGKPDRIFLSLGGPNLLEVKSALEQAWCGVPVIVEREACGNAILAAAKYMGCSAVVMCGTGSVAVGDTENGRKYAGGWGPVYGDGGSGGGLGSEALRLYLRSFDGHACSEGLAGLFSKLTEGLDVAIFENRMELKARALGMNRRDLAALAPEIYRLAEAGDPVAISLYNDASKEIANLAMGVSDRSEDFCVLLCGGFFAQKPMLIESCRRMFAENSCAALRYEPLFSPIVAAQLAVLEGGNITITEEIFDKLLNN